MSANKPMFRKVIFEIDCNIFVNRISSLHCYYVVKYKDYSDLQKQDHKLNSIFYTPYKIENIIFSTNIRILRNLGFDKKIKIKVKKEKKMS